MASDENLQQEKPSSETQETTNGQTRIRERDDSCEAKISGYVALFAVILVIGFEYVVFQILFYPIISRFWSTSQKIIVLFFFNLCTLMTIYSWVRTILTPPGDVTPKILSHYPPKEEVKSKIQAEIKKRQEWFKLPKEERDNEDVKVLRSNDIFVRMAYESYCTKCQEVKPPRAHHCRTCDKCILRMDHHCPWVNNCVGLQNQKFFLLFLAYSTVGMAIEVFFFVADLILHYKTRNKLFGPIICSMCIMAGIIGFALVLAIGFLFIYQIKNAARNLTSIDNRVDKIEIKNPFQRGKIALNLEEVFGQEKNKLRWFLPTTPPLGPHITKYKTD